jgi:hypothetical protein
MESNKSPITGAERLWLRELAMRYVDITMASQLPIIEREGMFSVMLRPCTCAILEYILDPAIGYVWVRRHTPRRHLQWWKTQAPLSEAGTLHEVQVRGMEFDLQLPTARFLELLPEFWGHGLVLFQMTRPVPDTLMLDGIADSVVDRVLMQNGLHLRFYLPHAAELAQVGSPRREVLEKMLQRREVREMAMDFGR